MVDTYGRWTYVPDTPDDRKCDLDIIADVVTTKYNFRPVNITLESFCEYIFTFIEDELSDRDQTVDDIRSDRTSLISSDFVNGWLYDNQPLSDFDCEY